MSKRLLMIHHTPSPHTQEMLGAVVAAATDPEIEGVDLVLLFKGLELLLGSAQVLVVLVCFFSQENRLLV